MKIAAYCRVSTDKEEQLTSLAHQQEFFVTYAQRSGHELIRIYADEGISGTSLKKREAFLRLMDDAKMGLFQMVVVKDVSRFARNTVDALQSVRHLKALGINTLFLTANMDSMGDSEFILTLFSAMAQEESANISKRTKFGKRINAEKGRVPQCIFGYDRLDNFTLAVNGEEAQVVRKIFTLYNQQGLGCRSISAILNREGCKTKFQNQWDARGVRRILTNPLYCGVLINHKYEIESFLTGHQVRLPSSQWYSHQRPEWAIVSPEVYQRAQEILASRQRKYDSGEPFRQGRYSGKHLFSTLIQCAHCGRCFCRKTYTYTHTRVYWRCATNDRYTAQRCSNRVCLDEPALIAQLQSYLSSLIGEPEAFISNVQAALEQALPGPAQLQTQREEMERRRAKLGSKQARYQEMFANDLISFAALQQKLSALQEEEQAVEASLAQLAASSEGQSHAPRYTAQIWDFLSLKTLTNADLRRIVENITVSQDGTVEIHLRSLVEAACHPKSAF